MCEYEVNDRLVVPFIVGIWARSSLILPLCQACSRGIWTHDPSDRGGRLPQNHWYMIWKMKKSNSKKDTEQG